MVTLIFLCAIIIIGIRGINATTISRKQTDHPLHSLNVDKACLFISLTNENEGTVANNEGNKKFDQGRRQRCGSKGACPYTVL